jgi:hypothetical protein
MKSMNLPCLERAFWLKSSKIEIRNMRTTMEISDKELQALRYAKYLLENVSLAAKISNAIGKPIEKGFGLLPANWSDVVSRATKTALECALEIAVAMMDDHGPRVSANSFHKLIVAATGAGGGAFGLAGLPVELPVSTTIMLRSVADIARSEGEQIRFPSAKLACLEVFALGGRSEVDDAANTGYFGVRAALGKAVSDAVKHITEKGLSQKGAPALARFIAHVASRFGITVSEKAAAQAIPIAGAAGGAIVNLLFMDHYQGMARGHFIVRRMERTYSPELIRSVYAKI